MTRTIIGNPAFDRQVEAPADTGNKMRREGKSENNPFKAGLFQTVTDVGFAIGQFTLVGGFDTGHLRSSGQSGWSQDGLNWFGNTAFQPPDNGQGTPLVSVSGANPSAGEGKKVILAGGFSYPSGGGVNGSSVMISFDDGRSWGDAGLSIKEGENTNTSVFGVGYNSKEKQFYVHIVTFRSHGSGGGTFIHTLYKGDGTGGWGSVWTQESGSSLGVVSPPYPPLTKICESNSISLPAKAKYCSINASGQSMHYVNSNGDTITVGFSFNALTINDAEVPVVNLEFVDSICAGRGLIVVVGKDADFGGPLVYVSDDDGGSWTRVLEELFTLGRNQVPGAPSYNIASVSFS